MKKLLLSLALLVQVAFVFAQEPIRLKTDKVKLYRQPTNLSEVMKVLNTTEDVVVIRKFNQQWSIVQVGAETGYIHNSRIPRVNLQSAPASASQK
jgi:hypothetical protein